MSPRIENHLKHIYDSAIDMQGKSAKDLEQQLQRLGNSEIDKKLDIIQELQRMYALQVAIEGLKEKHIKELQELGIADLDIPAFLDLEPVHIEKTTSTDDETEITVGPYIENAKPKMLLWVIQKDPRTKDYKYSLDEIVKMRLIEEYRNDEDYYTRSYGATTVSKSEFATLIINTCKKHNLRNITDYVNFVTNGDVDNYYMELYIYMAEYYGQMNPEEFKNKVLNRFGKSQELRAQANAKRQAEKDIRDKLKPSLLTRSQEITLVSKLTKEGVLEKINTDFLESGLSVDQIDELKDTLINNCNRLAKERGNKTIDKNEEYANIRTISTLIKKLTRSSRGWYRSQFEENRPAFAFLMDVMKQVNNDKQRRRFIDILFPKFSYMVDDRLTVGSNKKNN